MNHPIIDNKTYLDGMRNTFHDKCWFMSIIPERITHILDYGCADGSFMEFLRMNWPQYVYVGVDINPDFQKACQDRGFKCYLSIQEATKALGAAAVANTLVVMNSVLHEIYSYRGTPEAEETWGILRRNGYKCIALRDMYAKGCGSFTSKVLKEAFDVMSKDKCAADNFGDYVHLNEKFEDFEQQWGEVTDGYQFTHFLLKYFYNKNWERENMENYLPYHYRELHCAIREAGYDVVFENFYGIQWLKQKWLRDWDCDTHPHLNAFIHSVLTHMKLFIVAEED